MVTVSIPEWLVWTLLAFMLVQAILQIILVALRFKIDRAQRELDERLALLRSRLSNADTAKPPPA